MSEIARLLRVAADRNRQEDYTLLRSRVLKKDLEEARGLLEKDRISLNVLIEAVLRGYIRRHPAVLAMVDDWARENNKERKESSAKLKKRELDSIYDEIGSGMMDEEDI